MRLITWNVNGIRACLRKGFLKFLKREKPDILCVQETKANRSQVKEIWEEMTGYRDIWHSAEKPGYSGVLTLLKDKKTSVHVGLGARAYDSEGRVLISEHKDFDLINVYIPNGAASEERHFFKMKFLEDFLKILKKRAQKKPLIVTGDLNIAHQAIDIHDPVRLDGASGFKPEERQWMDRLIDAGFVDVFRHFYPSKKDEYSWWSYRQGSRERNKGWRLDYFMASRNLASAFNGIKILQSDLGSDHCPVRVDLY